MPRSDIVHYSMSVNSSDVSDADELYAHVDQTLIPWLMLEPMEQTI
jgi:hypothetical protein